MASYLKKQNKREDVDIYYASGIDDDLWFEGEHSWKVNKESDAFSWKAADIDGEYHDGKHFFHTKGIHKKHWKFQEY